MIQIALPFPPSVNCLFAGKARRYPSKRYKQWRSLALWEMKMHPQSMVTGPVAIDIELVAPDKRVRDVDNYSKALLDSLVHGRVLLDDSQVQRLTMRWATGEPGAVIKIEKVKTPPE